MWCESQVKRLINAFSCTSQCELMLYYQECIVLEQCDNGMEYIYRYRSQFQLPTSLALLGIVS